MPWKEENIMDLKTQFVTLAIKRHHTFSDLCKLFNISRKTGYKWLNRFYLSGLPGLEDQPTTPHHKPFGVSPHIIDHIIAIKKKHPTWGARKLKQYINRHSPHLKLPTEVTIHRHLKERGLTRPMRKRRNPGHPGKPFTIPKKPNDIWTTDYKGHFKLMTGDYCYPLTVMDEYSRFMLDVKALKNTAINGAMPRFIHLFKEFGLPRAIKSDNGAPFASFGLARLTKLSVLWIRLGIKPILTEPGSPQQNGKHERMHRTLKAEATIPPSAAFNAQQRRFNNWIEEYNKDRPHDSLGGQTPMDIYRPSDRMMPDKLPDITYPDHFEVRYVSNNGAMRWDTKSVGVTTALTGHYVGLEEVEEGIWAVYYSWKRLGFLNVKKRKILDEYGKLYRN